VASLFAEAWRKASGFRKSRIEPFCELDADAVQFLTAEVTDVCLSP